jgi:hypothetical protein
LEVSVLGFRRIFRNRFRLKHAVEAREWNCIYSLWADLRYAARILLKSARFTAIAVATLALAIGANTTIFSYANQMLFVRLHVPHPEQLRVCRLTADDHIAVRGLAGNDFYIDNDQIHLGLFPYPAYRQLRQQNHVVEDIAAFMQIPDVDITAAGTPEVGKAGPSNPPMTELRGPVLSQSSATASGIGNSAERETSLVKPSA